MFMQHVLAMVQCVIEEIEYLRVSGRCKQQDKDEHELLCLDLRIKQLCDLII